MGVSQQILHGQIMGDETQEGQIKTLAVALFLSSNVKLKLELSESPGF